MKAKKIAAIVFSYLIAIALIIGMWVLGYYTYNGKYLHWILLGVSLAVMLTCFIANIVLTAKFSKKYNDMSMKQLYEMSKQWKSEVESDYLSAQRKVDKLITLANTYLIFLIVIQCVFFYSLGCTKADFGAGIIGISIFAFAPLFFKLLYPAVEEQPKSTLISEKQFPMLYETARRAYQTTHCTGQLQLAYSNEGIAINKVGNKITVFLHPSVVRLLTQEELYNVLIHEFAHDVNVDTRRTMRYFKAEQKWIADDGVSYNSLFTSLLEQKLSLAITKYRAFSSRYHEIKADELVAELGNAQHYTNANAKSEMYKLYTQGENYVMNYEIFASDNPPENWYNKDIESFFNAKKSFEQQWKKQMEVELPAMNDSHPTFRMRMENANCTHYDCDTVEDNSQYVDELDRFIEFGNKLVCKEMKPHYQFIHEEAYLLRQKNIETYQKFKEGANISSNTLVECAKSLFNVDNSKAAEIAEVLIDRKSPWGYYIMAMVHFLNNDERCVPLFEEAMKTSTLAADCIQNIGLFALRSGNQQLLDEYRSRVADTMQTAKDIYNDRVWTPKIALKQCNLTEKTRNQLIDELKKQFKDDLTAIYMATYNKASTETHLVMVQFDKKLKPQQLYPLFEQLSEVIENFGDENICPSVTLNKQQFNAIKKVDGSLVYQKD
ncbi:MAG TPA: M48 family metalloprotease [Candidatus Limihabitans stercoravium]|nr:M48 family metalloprotease [Candidatus Limihabitans stercoravium]